MGILGEYIKQFADGIDGENVAKGGEMVAVDLGMLMVLDLDQESRKIHRNKIGFRANQRNRDGRCW